MKAVGYRLVIPKRTRTIIVIIISLSPRTNWEHPYTRVYIRLSKTISFSTCKKWYVRYQPRDDARRRPLWARRNNGGSVILRTVNRPKSSPIRIYIYIYIHRCQLYIKRTVYFTGTSKSSVNYSILIMASWRYPSMYYIHIPIVSVVRAH